MEGNLKPLILNKAEFFPLFSPHSHIFSAKFKLIFFFQSLLQGTSDSCPHSKIWALLRTKVLKSHKYTTVRGWPDC